MASLTDYNAHRRSEPEFNLREWDRKARIMRENPNSRRYSASYIRSFREDARSSGTNFTISSTASSPGYPLKEEIDPSTYSFTSALKALQAKTVYNNWDWLTPEGFSLNSKWNEAEKYICNPLSGEVPMECLSAKTLSGRSFRNLNNRFTMSAPLIYPNNSHPPTIPQNPKPSYNIKIIHEDYNADPTPPPPPVPLPEIKVVGSKRDVGVQSTPEDHSSSSPSAAETPPITERSLKRQVEADDSSAEFVLKQKAQEEEEEEVKLKEEDKEKKQQEMRENEEEEEEEEEEEAEEEEEEEEKEEKMEIKKVVKKEKRESGCFSWMRKRQRHKHKPTRSNNIFPICVPHLKGC